MARVRPIDIGRNVCAFLDTLAWAEIGPAMLADPASDDGYRVLVGSLPGAINVFDSYDDHPLPDMMHSLEYAPGVYSTAAGRYQILSRYWPHYKRQLDLPDFGPLSQDYYALQQIKEQRASQAIKAGDLAEAIQRCSNIWASLPGNHYGQPTHAYESLERAFVNAGGLIWDEVKK